MRGIVERIMADPSKYSVAELKTAVQNGTIPAYIGIPIIQQKMQDSERMKLAGQAAQAPQNQPSIAEQVLGQAEGVAALPSNLPTEGYAGGGVVAFADEGLVEGSDPAEAAQRERDRAALYGVLQSIGAASKDVLSLPGRGVAGAFESVVTRPLRAVGVPIPYLPKSFYGGDASSMTPYYDQLRRERGEDGTPAAAPAPTPPKKPPVDTAGAIAAGPPASAAGLPEIVAPKIPYTAPAHVEKPGLTNWGSLLEGLGAEKKDIDAIEAGVNAQADVLNRQDDPMWKAREARMGTREKRIEEEAKKAPYMAGLKAFLRIAQTRGPLGSAIAAGGEEGIVDLMKSEAATRAARDKLDELRDTMEMQQVEMRKGNRREARDLAFKVQDLKRQTAGLQIQAANAKDQAALSIYGTDVGQALKTADMANRRAETEATLDIQAKQVQQQGILGLRQLNLLESRARAGDRAAEARLAGVYQKAYSDFTVNVVPTLTAELKKKYGSLESPQAQRVLQQEWMRYKANALPSLLERESAGGARSADELLD